MRAAVRGPGAGSVSGVGITWARCCWGAEQGELGEPHGWQDRSLGSLLGAGSGRGRRRCGGAEGGLGVAVGGDGPWLDGVRAEALILWIALGLCCSTRQPRAVSSALPDSAHATWGSGMGGHGLRVLGGGGGGCPQVSAPGLEGLRSALHGCVGNTCPGSGLPHTRARWLSEAREERVFAGPSRDQNLCGRPARSLGAVAEAPSVRTPALALAPRGAAPCRGGGEPRPAGCDGPQSPLYVRCGEGTGGPSRAGDARLPAAMGERSSPRPQLWGPLGEAARLGPEGRAPRFRGQDPACLVTQAGRMQATLEWAGSVQGRGDCPQGHLPLPRHPDEH